MIHAYKSNGYNIIIDQNSGSVHSVDDVAFDIICCLDNGKSPAEIKQFIPQKYSSDGITEGDVDECLTEIDALKKDGKLFSEDTFKPQAEEFKKRQSVLKALCLNVTHGCNLACEYCFAGRGEYSSGKCLMSYETGKRALDFLVENSPGRHNLEVDFFGGEPLLNWEVCKKLVLYGRSIEKKYNKHFRFTLTTNGLLINDDVIDFCNSEMGNVVLSLDGRKEVNDRMRAFPNGKGSYDLILDNFKRFVDKRGNKEYYMRGTYTHYNTDFSNDIFHLADLGFKELSIEPVVCDPKEPYALTDDDLPVLKEQYEILATEMLRRARNKKGFNFYHYMIDLEGGPCIVKRISGCGVGTEYLAVTPTGDLYPCHRFVGNEKFKLGDIHSGITNTEITDKFKNCNVYSHTECENCFAKFYCSGGCSANAYYSTGKIDGVYEYGCELQRKRIECAIMLSVAKAQEGL